MRNQKIIMEKYRQYPAYNGKLSSKYPNKGFILENIIQEKIINAIPEKTEEELPIPGVKNTSPGYFSQADKRVRIKKKASHNQLEALPIPLIRSAPSIFLTACGVMRGLSICFACL